MVYQWRLLRPEPNVGSSKDLLVSYRLKAFVSHNGTPDTLSLIFALAHRVNNDKKVVKVVVEKITGLKKLAYPSAQEYGEAGALVE